MALLRKKNLNTQLIVSIKNRRRIKYSSIVGTLVILLIIPYFGIGSLADTSGQTLKDVEVSQWQKLGEKKIFLGYGSVGSNIIEGIQDISKEYPEIHFNFRQSGEPIDAAGGVFLHFWLNQSIPPESYAMKFRGYIEKNMQEKRFDIALIRFTPFYSENDIDIILANYASAIAVLKRTFPNTIFIHSTFGLVHANETWRTWLKKLLKKQEIWEYGDNDFINEYNQRMREKYKGKEPFFDLAEIQSTYPNGERSTFTHNGNTYYHMISEYTNDGTHLNEKGRKVVAEKLLLLLAGID